MLLESARKLVKRLFVLVLFSVACASPPPPAPLPAPEPSRTTPVQATEERAIGTVRANASTLNVRAEASASAEVVSRVRRGEKLALLEDGGAWLRVRLANGTVGWVASQHVVREGAAARPRRGCLPDSDYSFVAAPKPAFAEGSAHGTVVVDAGVDSGGNVVSTRVMSNTTGDPSLAAMAEREVRQAKFAPPVRNCAAKAFIYTYKRTF